MLNEIHNVAEMTNEMKNASPQDSALRCPANKFLACLQRGSLGIASRPTLKLAHRSFALYIRVSSPSSSMARPGPEDALRFLLLCFSALSVESLPLPS